MSTGRVCSRWITRMSLVICQSSTSQCCGGASGIFPGRGATELSCVQVHCLSLRSIVSLPVPARLSAYRFKRVFKLLTRLRPGDRYGRVIGRGRDGRTERGFQSVRYNDMVGLSTGAWPHTEPDVDLLEPGSVRRHPMDVEAQSAFTRQFAHLSPVLMLCGGMHGRMSQNEEHRVDAWLWEGSPV
jgi:hypothetical protein